MRKRHSPQTEASIRTSVWKARMRRKAEERKAAERTAATRRARDAALKAAQAAVDISLGGSRSSAAEEPSDV